jgi:uncharacterized protein YciI
MKYFLILHKPGPAWVDGQGFQDQDLRKHGAYIHRQYQSGVVIEGGPFLDHTGGMAIIKVETTAQAEAFIREDPAVKTGVFVAELHPWMRVDWETYG